MWSEVIKDFTNKKNEKKQYLLGFLLLKILEHKRKLMLSIKCKKTKILKYWNGQKWSGEVHTLCGLWSSNFFEKGDARYQLEGIIDALRRGISFLYAKCKWFRDTLGCWVEKCERIFHYTLAENLSS